MNDKENNDKNDQFFKDLEYELLLTSNIIRIENQKLKI